MSQEKEKACVQKTPALLNRCVTHIPLIIRHRGWLGLGGRRLDERQEWRLESQSRRQRPDRSVVLRRAEPAHRLRPASIQMGKVDRRYEDQ